MINSDILCVSEHWLTDQGLHSCSTLGDKSLVSAFSRTNAKNGGVAIFINNGLKCKKLDLDAFCVEKTFEVTGIELCDKAILILTIYHSPAVDSASFFDLLDQCLDYVVKRNHRVVIGGDFNIHLNFGTPESVDFVNLLRSHGFYVTNFQPTRGEACLDSAAVNFDLEDCQTEVVDPVVADHHAVLVRVAAPSVSDPVPLAWHSKYIFSFRHVDSNSVSLFQCALRNLSWNEILSVTNETTLFDSFFEVFIREFDNCFPPKFCTRPKPKMETKRSARLGNPVGRDWYTPQLNQCRVMVIVLNDRYRNAPTDAERALRYNEYLLAKRRYRRMVSEAKKAANERYIREAPNPCKAAWSVANGLRSKPVDFSCPSSPDDVNSFFVNAVCDIVDNLPPVDGSAVDNINVEVVRQLTRWRHVTPSDVCSIVGGFRPSTSRDVYGMSPHLLKEIVREIADPLACVINDCLDVGCFPDALKTSRVVPVYKKGDRALPSSYRPIAIVPVLAKVMEKIMYDQLVTHLSINNLLSDSQHGFRRGRSTTTAIMRLVERITGAFEQAESLGLVLLDLSKAFDVVSHEILLGKLEAYGVSGDVLTTFSSYLDNRKQVVALGGAMSGEQLIQHGVPQGSVLGPLLFLLMVNDFECSDEALQYADDTTLMLRGSIPRGVEESIAGDLAAAEAWFNTNRLQLNVDKTQTMICTLSRAQAATATSQVKLLGFTIDKKLNWQHHITEICKKLSRVIFLLRRLKRGLSESYLLTIYYGLFHSHLNYGIIVWGHAPGCDAVLKLQKAALRVITSSTRLEHCRPIFRRLGVLTVYGQYILSSLVYVKKTYGDLTTRGEIHHHVTRSRSNIDIPRHRLTATQRCFPTMAWKMFNRLPESVRNLDPKSFETETKKMLIQAAHYSIKEYMEDDL